MTGRTAKSILLIVAVLVAAATLLLRPSGRGSNKPERPEASIVKGDTGGVGTPDASWPAVVTMGVPSTRAAPRQANGDPLRVAALLTLEGDWAPYGLAYERGLRLAAKALAERGRPVDLRVLSYNGEKESGLKLARQARERDGVRVLVGMMSSSAIAHAADYLQSNDVALVDGAATRADLGRYPFFARTIPPDDAAARAAVAWVRESGLRRGVVVQFDDEWSNGLAANYVAAAADAGLELAPPIRLDAARSASSIRAAADRVRQLRPDFVLLAILGKDAAEMLRTMPPGPQRPPSFGTDNLVGEFAALAEASGDGVRFVVYHGAPTSPAFDRLFAGAGYGEKPETFTLTAFDALIAADAAARELGAGATPAALKAWLAGHSVPGGSRGDVRFDRDGNPSSIGQFSRSTYTWDGNTLVATKLPDVATP